MSAVVKFRDGRLLKVLVAPVISEKATMIAEKDEQVIFRVTPDATKPEIKAAVEMLFKVQVESVQVANRQGKQVALAFYTITDTNDFHLTAVTLTYPYDHIIDQRAVQSMQRLMPFLVGRPIHHNIAIFYSDGNIWVNFLLQCTFWPLYRNGVVGRYRELHFCWEGYGQFTNA